MTSHSLFTYNIHTVCNTIYYISLIRCFSCAGIVVYDVTQTETFDCIESWISDFREQCPTAMIMVAGNKCDLVEERVVSQRAIRDFTSEMDVPYVECSAKTNANVAQLFERAGLMLYRDSHGADPGITYSVRS